MADVVQIADHDRNWHLLFEALCDRIAGVLGPVAQRIEHVGSTAIPNLPAKPIIDIDVVVANDEAVLSAIERLAQIGYHQEGDLGVSGREAFTAPAGTTPHHLYVCAAAGQELSRHLALRDFLRTHPATAQAYGDFKRDLAQRFQSDRNAYTRAKAGFIERILAQAARDDHDLS